MLRSPYENDDPERILALGPFGSGKTLGWLKIADWAQQTGSPAQFYVIDTDNAVTRMMHAGGQFAHLKNVHVSRVWEWTQYEKALNNAVQVAKPGDWIVVDFVGSAWEAVQEWYIDQIFDKDVADFFLEARKAMKTGSPLDGYKDWGTINRIYKRWVTKMIEDCPAHIYWTATADSIRDTDDKSLRALFGAHGVKPKGQKHLGHQVHTVLYMQPFAGGEWFLNTIKDRERKRLEGFKINDFAVDYLVGVAGWEM